MDTDKNFYSIADVSDVTVKNHRFDPSEFGVNPAEIDDIVKLSHATNIILNDIIVDGQKKQRENCIDMNRECKQILISKAKLFGGLQNCITIKGGCENIILDDIIIYPGTGNCDIEIGNWSDQSYKQCKNITMINVRRADGQPVRLRVGRGQIPKILGGNVEYNQYESWRLKAYWWVKRIWAIIKFCSFSKHL